jgi:hypothetical protein
MAVLPLISGAYVLLGVVLIFGESDLIHGDNNPMRLTMAVLPLISGAYSESLLDLLSQ